MKTLKWSLLVALAAGLGFSTITLLTRSPRPLATNVNEGTDANGRNPAVERNKAVADQPAPLATVPVRVLASVVALTPDKTAVPTSDIASQPANVMRVRADQVLAQVNGKAIQLKDLAPLETQETEKTMTPEEYESRLNRALDMELTFQAATAQGVGLSAEQMKLLDSIAQKHEATLQDYRKQGVTWSSLTAAQLEFERRLTSALMLQQNLVAQEANVKPSPDAAIQARYEDTLRMMLGRLKSNARLRTASATL